MGYREKDDYSSDVKGVGLGGVKAVNDDYNSKIESENGLTEERVNVDKEIL